MHQPVIAIIEDDPALQALLQDALTDDGYATIGWPRGDGAHDLIRQTQPDLVMLDLWLEHPAAGCTVLRLLAGDPATQHIPVIVCSAAQQLLTTQAAELDAQGYVVLEKPFDVEELLTHVERLCARSDARTRSIPSALQHP